MAAIGVLPIISLALTAIGTGVAVAGSVAQGQAAKKAADFNSQVAQNNAKAAQDQATYQANITRQRGLRVLGTQRAMAGNSGADLSGSFSDVQSDTAINNEMDALANEYQGNVSSNRSRSQSQLDAMGGENAVSSSYWGAGSSILTGLGAASKNPMFEGSYSNYSTPPHD